MMRELQNKNSEIQSRFETAVENLKRYNQGNTLLSTDFSKYAVGIRYTEPLNKLRIQNSHFKNCCFPTPIVRTNISGSRFEKCTFEKINLENSNLQFSNLQECRFDSNNINGSNFGSCYMESVVFDNNTFIGSNFLRTQFKNCHILGGDMLSSSLEFAEFENTCFQDLRLANLSMEYSEFNHVKMKDVILPFAQLPFIFGGLDYIMSTKDSITISADMDEIQSISVDEYINTFEDWKIFFQERELYFPLANILLAQGKKEEALETILTGILMMINHADYRMLKYLCKLAATHQSVTITECKMLYSRINELISLMHQDPAQRYSYELHMNDIKNILVENPKCESRMYLSIQTNIMTDEEQVLYLFFDFLEKTLDCSIFGLTTKTISIRHDSPYEIIIIAIGSLYILNKILETISNTFNNIKVTVDDFMSIRDIVKNRALNDDLDHRLKLAALQKEELEVKKLVLEIEQIQDEIREKNIQTSITHNIKENDKIYIS